MEYIPFGKMSPPASGSKRWKGAWQYGIAFGVFCAFVMILYTFFLQDNPMHAKTILIASLTIGILSGLAGFFIGPFHISEPSDRTKPKSHFE